MSGTVLKGNLTGPIDVTGGGDWRLTATSGITSNEFYALASLGNLTGDLDLMIQGDIAGRDVAIGLGDIEPDRSSVSISIGRDARVEAQFAVNIDGPSRVDGKSRGEILGDNAGIVLENTTGSFVNHGSIVGELTAVSLHMCPDFVFVNTGEVQAGAETLALGVLHSDNVVIRNSGTIKAGGGAVQFADVENGTLINTGSLISADGGSVQTTFDTTGLTIRNSGEITGKLSGVSHAGGDIAITSSGIISAGAFAIQLQRSTGFETATAHVRNSGLIEAPEIFEVSSFGEVTIVLNNSGTMNGVINLGGLDDRILNSGKVAGDVDLGAGADTYRGKLQGHVTGKVLGGAGEDVLAGGDRNDRLDGGVDDDLLAGRGGNDRLWGRTGADILHGGEGDDHLIGGSGNDLLKGGSGKDVFVFGNDSGSDRIVDFEQGQDIIQIFGQADGFSGLTIETAGSHLRITHDGGEILMFSQASLSMSTADFMFS